MQLVQAMHSANIRADAIGDECVRAQPAAAVKPARQLPRGMQRWVVPPTTISHSALAFEYAWQKPHSSRHTARMWGVLGTSKCSVRTSVSVRRRALSKLLGHGVLGHEPLSVCEVA